MKQLEEFADGELDRVVVLKIDEEDELVEDSASIFDRNYKFPINNKFENQNYFSSSQNNLVVEKSSDYVPIEKMQKIKIQMKLKISFH